MNTIRVSNCLDQDQARLFIGPGLCPNCLQKLSADNISRQRVIKSTILDKFNYMKKAHLMGNQPICSERIAQYREFL